MADILLQNGFIDLAEKIKASGAGLNYESILGDSLYNIMKAMMLDPVTYTSIPYSSGVGLSVLSEHDEMMNPNNCPYSGSTSTATTQYCEGNVWLNGTVLVGASAKTTQDIVQHVLDNIDVLQSIYSLGGSYDNIIKSNIVQEYLKLKDFFETNSLTYADQLSSWYGIGFSPIAAPLSSTNLLKVCSSSFQSGVGANCNWTVPDGASRVKFQVWGAGIGTNPGCCCGGSPFGQTGAYSELTIDAIPGEQYTLCAGCACSIRCCSNVCPGPGCMSGVTGPGICCLKSDGASEVAYNWCDLSYARTQTGGLGSACCRFQSIACGDSGPCWCSEGYYCYDNSCATCGVVGNYPARPGFVIGCTCACDDRNPNHGDAYTHRGIHGGGCLDTNNYGYHIRPPIIDSDTGLAFSCTTGCSNQTFSSGTECGGCNGTDWTAHPGHGGAGTHIQGGTNNHKGDNGKGGMVQVSWV